MERKKKEEKTQNEEISCEIRSRVDEPLRFVGSLAGQPKRKRKKKNNPQTFQEISIVERISLSLSPCAPTIRRVGRRVFWPLKHYTDD